MTIFCPTFGSDGEQSVGPAPAYRHETLAPFGMTHAIARSESEPNAGAGVFVNRDFAQRPRRTRSDADAADRFDRGHSSMNATSDGRTCCRTACAGGIREIEAVHRTRDADVGQAALFFELTMSVSALVCGKTPSRAAQEHDRELEAFEAFIVIKVTKDDSGRAYRGR